MSIAQDLSTALETAEQSLARLDGLAQHIPQEWIEARKKNPHLPEHWQVRAVTYEVQGQDKTHLVAR